jgi:VIT1/CCC1 family predicted Fe2+/Mn2+ transporter
VIREGPISQTVHGAIEYAAGVLFIAAPFIFDFDDDAATAAAIIVGVLIIFVAATTNGPTSLVDSLPVSVHIVLDYALAAVLIASPFLFGYSDESAPTVFFIALGIVHLLITVATRFSRADRGAKA